VRILDHLRGPASLLALAASYAAGSPIAALRGLRISLDVGIRVRRAPVLRSDPSLLVSPRELAEVCSLVSDTHVIATGAHPAELVIDPGQWPWRNAPTSTDLGRGLERVLAHIGRHAARTVIWCGDEVDTGQPAEWRALLAIVAQHPELAHRMVPGNHDICFNHPHRADHDLARRASREAAFLAYAGPLARFPLVDPIIGDAGPVTTILLDSCRHRSRHILSNAIGMFGADQLARLAGALATTSGPVLIVAHHHVWRDARFMQPDAWFNTAVDADALVEIVSAYRRRARANHVLICHGHRHALTAGWIGEASAPIAVVGLPSTTLGDKSLTGQLDGVMRYASAGLLRDGSWGVAIREVGPLVDRESPRTKQRPATPPDASVRAYAVLGIAPR